MFPIFQLSPMSYDAECCCIITFVSSLSAYLHNSHSCLSTVSFLCKWDVMGTSWHEWFNCSFDVDLPLAPWSGNDRLMHIQMRVPKDFLLTRIVTIPIDESSFDYGMTTAIHPPQNNFSGGLPSPLHHQKDNPFSIIPAIIHCESSIAYGAAEWVSGGLKSIKKFSLFHLLIFKKVAYII